MPDNSPPGPRRWSREELVSVLGQPAKEWATLTPVEEKDGVLEMGIVNVDAGTEGAVPFIQFLCYPNHRRDPETERKVWAELRALSEQNPNHRDPEREVRVMAGLRALGMDVAHPPHIRVEGLVGREAYLIASQLRDVWGHGCVAAARVREGEPETWVLVHVCARHRALGLVAEPLSSI